MEKRNKRKSYHKNERKDKIEIWQAKQNVKTTTKRQVKRMHPFKNKSVQTEEILLKIKRKNKTAWTM